MRTACVYEDNNTQRVAWIQRFVRHWKCLYVLLNCLCPVRTLARVCVDRTGVSDCVSLCACLCVFCVLTESTCISENLEGQVSVWFHVRVGTQRIRLQLGSAVLLRGPQRLKFSLVVWLYYLTHTNTHIHSMCMGMLDQTHAINVRWPHTWMRIQRDVFKFPILSQPKTQRYLLEYHTRITQTIN